MDFHLKVVVDLQTELLTSVCETIYKNETIRNYFKIKKVYCDTGSIDKNMAIMILGNFNSLRKKDYSNTSIYARFQK